MSSDGYHYGYADKADARFIAAARQLVPELIAEVERLEERIAEQDQELRYWSNR
ncbi:hypothetical protein [Mycobacteroides abscessus]|uniref:Putative bacteriophage protein n=1 Tax=Mycobacteroides abscessus 1948 TaxID=1299323 RepID=A0A829QD85_9MYCO|nr:hypothetical protein [Mycobacteroides abscessus]EUA60259.1 putative bacteriophage protein [Mycobacteroides abscessus 1948]EIU47475.1 bacteriophage protein [Mycobacteroides abscessus 6G-0125-R]EIU49168.1 bacteriophage protein [Mycobacteroides abscessus 6G-0125-S]EIU59854.1 bacteriophage protein [Mycobacteroides abscessus 6G-0728-S]EIU64748.1 bacteriophage protein [Mycobacteroides abscessus 6G-1108]